MKPQKNKRTRISTPYKKDFLDKCNIRIIHVRGYPAPDLRGRIYAYIRGVCVSPNLPENYRYFAAKFCFGLVDNLLGNALSRYFARICSCFDTLILNNSLQGAVVLDSDAEDADDGRSSAVQTAEFLSRFQPPKLPYSRE